MKQVNWKSNIMFNMTGHSIVSGTGKQHLFLRRKDGIEIPKMKSKNVIQWKPVNPKRWDDHKKIRDTIG